VEVASLALLSSPDFFYDALHMRLTYSASSRRIWDIMPWEARLQFLEAVFFTFLGVGFLLDLANPTPGRTGHILFLVFMGGTIGVAYGFCFMRAPKLIPVLVAVHVALALAVPHLGFLRPIAVDWAHVASTAAGVDVIGCLFAILLGYVFFVRFVRKQGLRFVQVQTEIELAQQIHRSLVPPIAASTSLHEFYGLSVPSGEMGGDLVDLVQDGNKWIGYLADVSGHGVPSGVLMAMVKSAARMRLVTLCESQVLLEDLNRVISELKAADTFVTLAYVALGGSNDLHFATAGHLPILHFRSASKSVCELSTSNPPIGIFKEQEFATSRMEFSSGDIAVLLTDGLTEVTNEKEQEYGIERIKQQVERHSTESLKIICETLLAESRRFGKQMDDQSVLLVRRF
jgi:serine phosphatase RsbU (regulator of sigma subunit)